MLFKYDNDAMSRSTTPIEAVPEPAINPQVECDDRPIEIREGEGSPTLTYRGPTVITAEDVRFCREVSSYRPPPKSEEEHIVSMRIHWLARLGGRQVFNVKETK